MAAALAVALVAACLGPSSSRTASTLAACSIGAAWLMATTVLVGRVIP